MTPTSELDRLFRDIPKPAPLMCGYCGDSGDVHSISGEWLGICTECGAFEALHLHKVDADETNHGPCAQGDEHAESS